MPINHTDIVSIISGITLIVAVGIGYTIYKEENPAESSVDSSSQPISTMSGLLIPHPNESSIIKSNVVSLHKPNLDLGDDLQPTVGYKNWVPSLFKDIPLNSNNEPNLTANPNSINYNALGLKKKHLHQFYIIPYNII